jgi:hypothetical protein
MTGTNHGMTGAVIAVLIHQPAIAIPLSFTSHFVCDSIPHFGLAPGDKLFDKKFNVTLVSDFLVAVTMMAILGILFPAQRWLIWACMIAAASPDLMWAYYHLYVEKIKNRKPNLGPLARFHGWIQWSQTPKGWFVEIAWFMATGTLLLIVR